MKFVTRFTSAFAYSKHLKNGSYYSDYYTTRLSLDLEIQGMSPGDFIMCVIYHWTYSTPTSVKPFTICGVYPFTDVMTHFADSILWRKGTQLCYYYSCDCCYWLWPWYGCGDSSYTPANYCCYSAFPRFCHSGWENVLRYLLQIVRTRWGSADVFIQGHWFWVYVTDGAFLTSGRKWASLYPCPEKVTLWGRRQPPESKVYNNPKLRRLHVEIWDGKTGTITPRILTKTKSYQINTPVPRVLHCI